jgi:hypothetical protein
MRWLLVIPLGAVLPALQGTIDLLRLGSEGLSARSSFLAAVTLGSLLGVAVGLGWVFKATGRLHAVATGAAMVAALPVALGALAVLPWLLPHPVSGFLASFLPLVLCTFAAWDFFSPGP